MARDYKSEYKNYHSTEKAKKQRARNNKARREAERNGKARKGDGKDVAHSKPGARGKTYMQSKHDNRSFARDKNARRKKS